MLLHPTHGRSGDRNSAILDLAAVMYRRKIVRNYDDSFIIASEVLTRLYPDINEMLRNLDYSVSDLIRVELTKTTLGQIHCNGLFAAL